MISRVGFYAYEDSCSVPVTRRLQMVSNLFLTNVLHISYYIATLITAVLVIIGNYVFSKLLVFRKKK